MEKINHLFKRKEVTLKIEKEKTPSNIEAVEIIAKKFNSSSENITIRGVRGQFGSKTFLIEADIYDNADVKSRFGTFKKRNKRKKKGSAGGKK